MKTQKDSRRRGHRSTAVPTLAEGIRSHTPAEILANLGSTIEKQEAVQSIFYWKGPTPISPDRPDSMQ